MPRQNSQQCNQNSQHDLQHQGHQMSATKESHYDNHTEKNIPAERPFDNHLWETSGKWYSHYQGYESWAIDLRHWQIVLHHWKSANVPDLQISITNARGLSGSHTLVKSGQSLAMGSKFLVQMNYVLHVNHTRTGSSKLYWNINCTVHWFFA